MTWQLPQILYDNRLEDGTPTATQTDSGYDALNLKDWRTYTYWQGTGTSPYYLTVDCGNAKTADTLAILSHNLYTIGATIYLECSSDNFSGDITEALAGFAPATDKIIYKNFTSQSKRYWRLKITFTGTKSPRIGILCFGDRITFPYSPEVPFDPTPETVQAESNVSQAGNLLGAVVDYLEVNPKPQWKDLDPSWINTYFNPFWYDHAYLLTPFFWAWEPGDHVTEVFLVSVKPGFNLGRPYESGTRQHVSLDLVGIREV